MDTKLRTPVSILENRTPVQNEQALMGPVASGSSLLLSFHTAYIFHATEDAALVSLVFLISNTESNSRFH